MQITIKIKPFSFNLTKNLNTFRGVIFKKKGWLLHIENEHGQCGWGEVAPLQSSELISCNSALQAIEPKTSLENLEALISQSPKALAFGLGAALGELNGLVGFKNQTAWLKAPKSAILLPTDNSLLEVVDCLVDSKQNCIDPLTVKWKVAINDQTYELKLLKEILSRLPINSRLRIDPNTGWNREQAEIWVNELAEEPRLEWLEQPLNATDIQGLKQLSKQVPIALDESLILKPYLRNTWKSWQIRRPLLEGDPRILLNELEQGKAFRSISTGFETGIARRWVSHLAALQQKGPTPTAPGLAPGWLPESQLFSSNPKIVWEAV